MLMLRCLARWSNGLHRALSHLVLFGSLFANLFAVDGAPLLFGSKSFSKVAPVILDNTGAAASVELARIENHGWGAQYDRISRWFDNSKLIHITSNAGDSLILGKDLSLINIGDNSFKVINKSNKWQNLNFKGHNLVYVIAPKSSETISPELASGPLQVFPLSGQQATSIYRYGSDT